MPIIPSNNESAHLEIQVETGRKQGSIQYNKPFNSIVNKYIDGVRIFQGYINPIRFSFNPAKKLPINQDRNVARSIF